MIPYGHYPLIDDPKAAVAEKRPFKLTPEISLEVKEWKSDVAGACFYHFRAVHAVERVMVSGLIYVGRTGVDGIATIQDQTALPEEPDKSAEMERWKMAAGEYYQAKERHRETLEKIRRHLNDPLLSDTAKVIRAQAALTGRE
jgi:hypothetical protein